MSQQPTADLAACDQEQIHIPGAIQPFGALLAIRPGQLQVVQASENLERVMGVPARDAIGRGLQELIGEEACAQLRLALTRGDLHMVSPTAIRLPHDGRRCYMYYNSSGPLLLAEFEAVDEEADFFSTIGSHGELPFGAIHECATHEALCALLAREMRRITGFDRCIVYRFDEDWHGTVIAEEKNEAYRHAFLGHHFPASDIPAQARKLFTLNRFRVIPDVDYRPVPLHPGGDTIDMSFCTLRNVAPVHLEYLSNMGVRASLTVSLMCGDRLWGMITCHHSTPHAIPIGARMRSKVLAELASYAIAGIERNEAALMREVRQQELKKLQEVLAGSPRFSDALQAGAPHMLKALGADALVLRIGGQTLELGAALPQAALGKIREALQRELRGLFAYTRNLAALDGELTAAAQQASGALYMRLGEGDDHAIAVRREVVEARNWAGDPRKPVTLPADGRLHPRKSFELWQEAVRGHSSRWLQVDIEAAAEMRRLLLERGEQIARREFEGALRIERDRSSEILEAMGEGFLLADRALRVIRVNSEGLRLAGRTTAPAPGVPLAEFWPQAFAPSSAILARALSEGSSQFLEQHVSDGDAGDLWLDIRIYPSGDGLAIFFHDVSARKGMEAALRDVNDRLEERVAERTGELQRAHEQLHQSQKMEALGQLTGGIAHDFNNLLASIIASMDMMELRLQQGQTEGLQRYVETATGATERAAALIHRLLSFARQQSLKSVPVHVNRLIGGLQELVQRAVGPANHLELRLAPELWPVSCDPNQLENALLNLAINARDAMPEGGVLAVETRNLRVETDAQAQEAGLPRGDHVSISVSDTGTGMPPEVVARAFDPFFTTKPVGKGTGLGLSMIYGFVRQSGGDTKILSRPGEGTTIRIFLPRHEGAVDESRAPAPPLTLMKTAHAAQVLLVEDEPQLRALLHEMLAELGCAVTEAEDADSARAVLQSGRAVDLMISDVGLPGKTNGRRLLAQAREMRPRLKALLITGFGDQALLADEVPGAPVPTLTKPFAIETFAARVVDLLRHTDGQAQPGPARST